MAAPALHMLAIALLGLSAVVLAARPVAAAEAAACGCSCGCSQPVGDTTQPESPASVDGLAGAAEAEAAAPMQRPACCEGDSGALPPAAPDPGAVSDLDAAATSPLGMQAYQEGHAASDADGSRCSATEGIPHPAGPPPPPDLLTALGSPTENWCSAVAAAQFKDVREPRASAHLKPAACAVA